MREIKFRAWDKESERMVYDPYHFEIYNYSDENRGNQTTYRYYEDWRCLEDGRGYECELMQYTGLKDKNGKEIYEGDIITFLNGETTSTESGMDCDEFYTDGEIFWCSSRHGWDVTGRIDVGSEDALRGDVEVRGNIHQHKHLLE